MNVIGEMVRKIRKEKKITLKQLAEQTGVSISFLSQVELGKCNATLESLRKICDALQVSPSVFFEQATTDDVKEALPFYYENLASNNSAATFQPMLVTLQPNQKDSKEFTHLGYEFIYVLEGELSFSLEEQKSILKVGESIMFSSSQSHIWWNDSLMPTKFLLITSL
ncbi:helix-turn-helix domain-containing protein [Bacillus ndiopicus]|uniref:helix-turn-helix domain-containing protein n=1 Tax=Bacillus ndiopicus TaxID=1347368 RepID=UPI0005A9369B|nr:XRE family transcriptional regulator [Bacillus ndiopicus]